MCLRGVSLLRVCFPKEYVYIDFYAIFKFYVILELYVAFEFHRYDKGLCEYVRSLRGFLAYGYLVLVRVFYGFVRLSSVILGSFRYFLVFRPSGLRGLLVRGDLYLGEATWAKVSTRVLVYRVLRNGRVRIFARAVSKSRYSYGLDHLFSVVKYSNYGEIRSRFLDNAATYGYHCLVYGFFLYRRVVVSIVRLRNVSRYS